MPTASIIASLPTAESKSEPNGECLLKVPGIAACRFKGFPYSHPNLCSPREGGMLLRKAGNASDPRTEFAQAGEDGEGRDASQRAENHQRWSPPHEYREADPHRAAYRERNQQFLSEGKNR